MALPRVFYTFDRQFLALLGSILVIGLIMLASASWPLGYDKFGDGYYFLTHQILAGLIPGIIGGLAAWRLPYENLRRFAPHMLGISIVLLVLVFIPGIGADFGTSHSWISLGFFSFQPSEIVKLSFLIYLAAWFEKRSHVELREAATGFVPFVTVLGTIMLLLFLQPDTGSMGIIVAMALAVFFAAGAPMRHMAIFGSAAVLGVVFLLYVVPSLAPTVPAFQKLEYRTQRFVTFLHPSEDVLGAGYHINQAMLAIGSGGAFGRGYGHSLQKFQYLPEVAGDSIFAVMAEEMGFFLTSGFICLYLSFLFRGYRVAEGAPDAFGKYLVIGIMTWFGVQAFVNIGAMVSLVPITGVPLPFVSYGGTALVVSMTAAGIVLNVSAAKKAN